MKNTKYGFYIFHVNTDMISLANISNKRLKHIHTKAAVKQKKLTIYAATILRLSSTQQ